MVPPQCCHDYSPPHRGRAQWPGVGQPKAAWDREQPSSTLWEHKTGLSPPRGHTKDPSPVSHSLPLALFQGGAHPGPRGYGRPGASWMTGAGFPLLRYHWCGPHTGSKTQGPSHRRNVESTTRTLSAAPALASGTFNPLCKVLCILQSLYLYTIGRMAGVLPCQGYTWHFKLQSQATLLWDTDSPAPGSRHTQASVGDSFPL